MGSPRKCGLCSMLGRYTVAQCSDCGKWMCDQHITWFVDRWICKRDMRKRAKRKEKAAR